MPEIIAEGNITGAFAPGQEALYAPKVETTDAPDNQVTPSTPSEVKPAAAPAESAKPTILGKFKDREALNKSTISVAEKLGVSLGNLEDFAKMPQDSAEAIYKALEARLGSRKKIPTGTQKDMLLDGDGELNDLGKHVEAQEADKKAKADAAAEAEAKAKADAEAKPEDKKEETPGKEVTAKLPDGSDITFNDDGYSYGDAISDEDKSYAKESYGDAFANLFEQVGLHAKSVDEYWTKNGRFPNEAYARLEKAAVPRHVVDSYLAGVANGRAEHVAAQTADVATKEAAEAKTAAAEAEQKLAIAALEKEVFDAVGGRDSYKRVVDWAGKALPENERNAYERIIQTGDAMQIKMAFAGLKARFEENYGSAPELISGGSPAPSADVFKSHVELLAAMNDPRYSNDPSYNAEVVQKVARTQKVMAAARGGKKK